MIVALLLSFATIFVAELGDKSQLMAMTFALRHRWPVVLGAIAAASVLTHALSVVVGHYLGGTLPTTVIAIGTGVVFVLVGLWSLRPEGSPSESRPRWGRSAILRVTSAFLVAELADKTMFATITLAVDHHWLGVWIGSALGMLAADGLAVLLGLRLGKHVPQRIIQLVAAYTFMFLGSWTVFGALAPEDLPVTAVVAAAGVIPALVAAGWWQGRASAVHTAAEIPVP